MNKVLSINAGSSSLKFRLIDMPEEFLISEGIIERIGEEEAVMKVVCDGKQEKLIIPILNHEIAVNLLIEKLKTSGVIESLNEIKGIGHRVVHGGERFSDSVLITPEVIDIIESLIDLAPLHNPANLTGIKIFMKVLPNIPHVAVFDTAFHQTMEEEVFIYGAPYEWYTNHGVRKYGFHGTSHKYISDRMKTILGKDHAKIISCHLGNGSSICAIDGGRSIDTTMGFTPLTGLLMGTRCGDIDAAIIPYIAEKTHKNVREIESELYKKSGLLGISGLSNDSRDIETGIAQGNKRCILAQNMFTRRIASYIASYFVLLGGADAIVFTAGIGENSSKTREDIMNRLEPLGVRIDHEANKGRQKEQRITSDDSKIACYVIPTNEEIVIARDVIRLLN